VNSRLAVSAISCRVCCFLRSRSPGPVRIWALVIEQLVRGFASTLDAVDVLQRWLPGTNAGALVAALGAPTQEQGRGTPGITDVVGGTHATLVIAAYLITLTAATAIVLCRRDVT